MTLVLDASMTVTWLFTDEQTESAHSVLRRVVAEGAIMPSLWRSGVANVRRNAERRDRCTDAYVDQSLAKLARLPIKREEKTKEHAWGTTGTLAQQEDLTLYDAAYLELALRKGMPLVSCDKALLATATRKKTEVLTA